MQEARAPHQFRSVLLPYLGCFVRVEGVIGEIHRKKEARTMYVHHPRVYYDDGQPDAFVEADHAAIRIDSGFMKLLLAVAGLDPAPTSWERACRIPVRFRAQVVAYVRPYNGVPDLGMHRAEHLMFLDEDGRPMSGEPVTFTYKAGDHWVVRRDDAHRTHQALFQPLRRESATSNA